MPNGNPKFHQEEFPVLEAFFSTKSKILNEFKEEWSQIANDYEKIWKPYGREFIEKDVEKYPKLKM